MITIRENNNAASVDEVRILPSIDGVDQEKEEEVKVELNTLQDSEDLLDQTDENENLENSVVELKKLKSQLGEQIKQLSEIRRSMIHNETEKSLVKDEDDALKSESVRAVEKSLTSSPINLSGDEEYLQLKI